MHGATRSRAAGGLAVAVALLAFGCGEEPSRPPDMLLIVLDTARADRMSAYGYERPTTPGLTALAAAGVLFEDATAPASWTPPSHASLFTGEMPEVHGVHLEFTANGVAAHGLLVSKLREDLPTLA